MMTEAHEARTVAVMALVLQHSAEQLRCAFQASQLISIVMLRIITTTNRPLQHQRLLTGILVTPVHGRSDAGHPESHLTSLIELHH